MSRSKPSLVQKDMVLHQNVPVKIENAVTIVMSQLVPIKYIEVDDFGINLFQPIISGSLQSPLNILFPFHQVKLIKMSDFDEADSAYMFIMYDPQFVDDFQCMFDLGIQGECH